MRLFLIIVTIVAVVAGGYLRWSLASTVPWHCDEIPLLTRLTGLCGHVANEAQAQAFTPTLYSCRAGVWRSLRPPKDLYTVHTTTAFWANLTLHLFGYTLIAGRAAPLAWSIVAVLATAWATWLACRSLSAVCAAAWVIALSPSLVVAGAQARGYAEAVAVTALLLVALDHLRRRPEAWPWASLLLLWAVQSAFAVYTTWVYWTLPILGVAVATWPRAVSSDPSRRPPRGLLVVTVLGAVVSVGIYTVDRWSHLTFQATQMGQSLAGASAVGGFLHDLARSLLPYPALVTAICVAGVWTLRRSPTRWWLWLMAGGVAAPVIFALATGSVGYARNLMHLVVPLAVLFGAGVEGLARAGARRLRPAVATAGIVVLFASLTVAAWRDVKHRAEAMLQPDWGRAALALNEQPSATGFRWVCPCLVNHWQILWYSAAPEADRIDELPPGATVEVVMGAEGVAGRPARIYRVHPSKGILSEGDLPEYIAAASPTETIAGVEIRRWCGKKMDGADPGPGRADDPVFLTVHLRREPGEGEWRRFFARGGDTLQELVTFKVIDRTWSMIAPRRIVPGLLDALGADLDIQRPDVVCFALSPPESRDAPVSPTSEDVARPSLSEPGQSWPGRCSVPSRLRASLTAR